MTEILAHTPLLLKAFLSSLSSSSPTIIHDPPKGSSFKEYFVPPFSKEYSLGPIPRENSVTPTPFFFANKKCPNS